MMKDKNVSLVLEGGGVKCAYQVGALMALEENGYSFKAISGASFGALNGALYIEGGIKKLFDYYTSIKTKDIFIEENICNFVNFYNGEREYFTNAFLAYMKENASTFLNDRNKISDYYHAYVAHLVNEDAIRNSEIKYMFSVLEVTNTSITLPMIIGAYFSRNMAPLNLLESNGTIRSHIINKDTCKKGMIPLYVAASANYPYFNPLKVEDRYYLDGGITNNAPYEVLLASGHDKIIVIRTKNDDLQGKIPQDEDILVITPSQNLGSSLYFTHDNIMELIKLGYQDTLAILKNNN